MKSELDFFLLHHRVFLVKNFYQCNGDYYGVKTKYEINYKDRNDSPKFSCDVLIEVVNLFEETGSVFKPPENTVQTACEQIEQVYIKTEDPEEVLFEDEIEVHNPVKCFFGPPVFEEYNLTQIRDLTRVQNSTSDSNTSNDNTEKAPLIQEIKTEIADEEPKKLHEFCVSCKKSLKRNHTEHHEPDEELSSGSSSRYEGPKPAKVAKKNTEKKRLRGENSSQWITDEAIIQVALQEILQDRLRIKEANEVFGIPKTTLYTRLQRIKTDLPDTQKVSLLMGLKTRDMVNKFASQQIFTMAQEENLITHLLEFSKHNFGLTQNAIRKLAYQYAVSIDQKIPPSWETNERAGGSWPYAFLKRHR
ncbi:uncharacterized protein LOC129803561 isoform X5 [Phlebotomus papatasi]|nr:uncharacterized protein LOC129803561 isoform X5 [Phlebotomus papatasi]